MNRRGLILSALAVGVAGFGGAAWYAIPAGQSGHPLSRFYDNFLLLWTQGDYLTMTTDITVARGAAAGVTRLFPSTQAIAQ